MTINYLPGKANPYEGSVAFINWHNYTIAAYCSGNNLIVLTKNFEALQTIYLPGDSRCCDINKHNGKIAVAVGSKIMIFNPVIANFFDYTYYTNRKNINILDIKWVLELEIVNPKDDTLINSINWSDNCDSFLNEEKDFSQLSLNGNGRIGTPNGSTGDKVEFDTETSAELVVGSDRSLTLWRLFYLNKHSHAEKRLKAVSLWHKIQPSPVYLVKLSPDTTFIASCGKFDKLVKVWRRLTFGIESAEFDLSYAKHNEYVTTFKWRSKAPNRSCPASRHASYPSTLVSSIGRLDSSSMLSLSSSFNKVVNILYTFAVDSSVKVFSSFETDSKHVTQFNGSVNLHAECPGLKGPVFAMILDNDLLECCLNDIVEDLSVESSTEGNTATLQIPKNRNRSNSSNSIIQEKEIKLTQLISRNLDLMVIVDATGRVEFVSFENVSQYPPKVLKASRMDIPMKMQLSQNCFPKLPQFLTFSDFLITQIYNDKTDVMENSLSFTVNDLEKGSVRHLELLFDDLANCLLSAEEGYTVISGDSDDGSSFFEPSDESANNLKHKVYHLGTLKHKYAGHDKSIQHVRRSIDGSAVVSLTRFGESHVWVPDRLSGPASNLAIHAAKAHHHYFKASGVTLSRKSLIETNGPVIDAVVLGNGGDFVATMVDGNLVLWDCRLDHAMRKIAKNVAQSPMEYTAKPAAFFLLPERGEGIFHAVAIYTKNKLLAWEIAIDIEREMFEIKNVDIEDFPTEQEELHLVSAIDPVGWESKLGDSGSVYKYDINSMLQRDVLAVIDIDGNLRIYSLTMGKSEIKWILKSHNRTNVKSATYIKGSSIKKCAVADSSCRKLTIWDTKSGFLEYEEDLSEIVRDLDWTCTNQDGVSILSVGFQFKVLLYSQLRYDYTNETPSYAIIRSIDITDMTDHDIGDSTWLTDGTLVIGSGNQFYVVDRSLDAAKDKYAQRILGSRQLINNDIFTMGSLLNGPLPFFHPQFLIQSLFLEKFDEVKLVLTELYETIRDLDLDPNGDIWRDMLPSMRLDVVKFAKNFVSSGSLQNDEASATGGFKSSKYEALFSNDNDDNHLKFNKQLATSLIEKLQKIRLPFLTGHQQITLVSVIEIVLDIDSNFKNLLDDNGLRYYLGLKLYQLNASKAGFGANSISKRDISFALHSENKDLLFNIVNEMAHSRLVWSAVRNYGLVYWSSNEKLTEQFEKVAKNEFMKFSDEHDGRKDPTSCSIFYLALRKKQILVGLWKTSIGHPEQAKMLKFLKNDFKEKRWRTAAMKNAFALLSKHRYMDAANFFLLADSPKDSVNVIIKQLNDLDLAIGVARCYEGHDGGEVLQFILTEHILCSANSNNRWLKSYAYHMLGQHENSVKSLIDEEFVDKQLIPTTSLTLEPKKKSFVEYDPVLIVLYRSLRKIGVSSANEYRFIAKVVNIYNRMGCDLLSLYIVRNWFFHYGDLEKMVSEKDHEKLLQHHSTSSPRKNKLTEKLELGTGQARTKFVEPPKSLEFDMSAFSF